MNIVYKNYTLEPEDVRWNLYKTVPGTSKQGEPIETKLNFGYGMTFEHCLNSIVCDELKNIDGDVSVLEWIKEYKKANEIITNCLTK